MTQPKIFFPKPNLDPAPQILMIRLDLFFIILLQPLPLLTHTFLLLPFPTRLCLKNIKSFRSQIISLRSQKKNSEFTCNLMPTEKPSSSWTPASNFCILSSLLLRASRMSMTITSFKADMSDCIRSYFWIPLSPALPS